MTIVRYTHATEKKGGVEQYLDDINQALLQRNKMTIIQLFMPIANYSEGYEYENIGRGTLIRVPMISDKQESNISDGWSVKRLLTIFRIKTIIRDALVYNRVFLPLFRRLHCIQPYSRYKTEPVDAKDKLLDVVKLRNIDLIIIHSAGGWGSSEVIREANIRDIPYLILNHFSNERFMIVGFREQARSAVGVGGVSGKKIPRYLKNIYRNLSDGIDTEFFSKNSVRPTERVGVPLVMLPARVVPGKGHNDLICAIHLLKKKGVKCRIVFAGRDNYVKFVDQLLDVIRVKQMEDSIHFVGELSREEMRTYYALSSVVVLPSDNEGLGRVLLEAQSMGVPVVAYNVGGVSEAVLDRVSGYLVDKGDIEDLAVRIGELLVDEMKRTVMGKAGRGFVEGKFSYSSFAKRHEDWYLDAINGRMTRTWD